MAIININAHNMPELQLKLETMATETFNRALNKSCLLVENDAKINCPVDNGVLRNSITHKVNGNEGIVYTNIEYAPYVEMGTGLFAEEGNGRKDRWCYQDDAGNWHSTIGQHPQPYMRPALNNNIEKIVQQFVNDFREDVMI